MLSIGNNKYTDLLSLSFNRDMLMSNIYGNNRLTILNEPSADVQCPAGRVSCIGNNICCQPDNNCPPNLGPTTDQNDTSCDNNFMMKCSGLSQNVGTDIDSVISFWNTLSNQNTCISYYTAYLNTSVENTAGLSTCSSEFNTARYDDVNCYINNIFTLYTNTYEFTDDTTDPKYNAFQNVLSNLCGGGGNDNTSSEYNVPQGGCDRFLKSYCSTYSRNEIAESDILLKLCGCYSPQDTTVPDSPPDSSQSKACDYLCNHIGTTQLYDSATGGQFTCDANVCVIADTNIIAAQTRVGGGVVFSQICPGCSSDQPCKCVITNVTTTDINRRDLQESVQSSCGTGSTCYFIDAAGNSTSVPCQDLVTPPPPFYETPLFITIISLVILAVVVIVIIILVMFSGKSHKTVNIISPEDKDKYTVLNKAISSGENIKEI